MKAVTNDPVTSAATSPAHSAPSRRHGLNPVATAVRISIACDDDINWRLYLEAPTRTELRAAQKRWRDIDSPTPGERACVAQFDRRKA